MSRIARLVALSLPLLVACVLAVGGLRIHDGRVERSSHLASPAAASSVTATPTDASAVGEAFRSHLTVSIPWPAFAALLLLCVLPTIASLLAWTGARRSRRTSFAVSRGAS